MCFSLICSKIKYSVLKREWASREKAYKDTNIDKLIFLHSIFLFPLWFLVKNRLPLPYSCFLFKNKNIFQIQKKINAFWWCLNDPLWMHATKISCHLKNRQRNDNHFVFVKYLKYVMLQNITTCLLFSYPVQGKSSFQFKI